MAAAKVLDGKKIVVTGAGRGIGAAIARAFADEGADLVLAARSRDELDGVAAEIRGLGREAHVVPTDLAEIDQVERLASESVRLLGGVDSRAGCRPAPRRWESFPEARWCKRHAITRQKGTTAAGTCVSDPDGLESARCNIYSLLRE